MAKQKNENEITKTLNVPIEIWRTLINLKTELNVRAVRDVLQMLVDNYNAKR